MPSKLLRPRVSIGGVVWIVIGLIVAFREGFVGDLGSLSAILSLVLAVVVWPLVLLDIHFGI